MVEGRDPLLGSKPLPPLLLEGRLGQAALPNWSSPTRRGCPVPVQVTNGLATLILDPSAKLELRVPMAWTQRDATVRCELQYTTLMAYRSSSGCT